MTAERVGPESWPTTRLGWLFRPVSDRGHEDATVLSVYRDFGVIRKGDRTDNSNRTPENLSSYQLVQFGDLVVNRMKAWQGSLGVSKYEGIVSADYEVLRPTVSQHDGRFLHYLLRSRALTEQYGLRSTGIRPAQWRLYWNEMKTIEVGLPPPDEQRAIADYLDRETARTDSLIEEQRRLTELLRERRSAVLAAAFAEGTSTVATKVGRLLTARPSYGVLVPRYVDEADGVSLVRVGDLLNLTPDRPMQTISQEQSEEYCRTRIVGGEVLLGVVGKMGQAVLAPSWLAGANVARAVAVLRCSDSAVAALLCAWFESDHFLRQADLATSGDSIQPTLGMKDLARFDIKLPTQRAAAANLASRLKKISALVEETDRFIELARERRAGLITAAVTGQIDVREMA